MKRKHLWTILLALLSALLLTAAAGASENIPETPVRAVVVYDENAGADAMAAALEAAEGVTVLWQYDSLFPGAAVEADAACLRKIEALDGVAGVSPVRSYTPASVRQEAVWSEAGLALMGADALWQEGLTGDGAVIAVLDSGFNTSHEVFADASLTRSPAVSKADVEAFAANRGTAGQYVSVRIPFVYDYYNGDSNVSTTVGHGTHVAALAAGYALDEDGAVRFRGAAPGAQILGMKIFPDNSGGGTDDAVILRALEDAWNLGADVINISVGTGAGFSQDDVLDGAYCKAFSTLASEGVIICCSAGNEETPAVYKTWTRPLPTGAYTDYSAITSPASYRDTVAVAAAGELNGRAFMAGYSSWGPASGLHLSPTLTAFGGPIASAGASASDVYYSDYGTSMASGCASGLFAVTLQSLREQGVTNRKEAAQLAQSLLESTAQLLTDEQGVPLSPRKQGAGLVALDAALSSRLVIRDSLAELGDSGDGRFQMSFTVKNLSDQAADLSLTVQILTDAYLEDGGTYFSRMSPMDISGGVAVSGPDSLHVPAGGEAEASFELTVSSQLRQTLAEVYPNGFYVEGYVTAAVAGQAVHGTFLGYCGDWEAAPVMETPDFRDIQDESFRRAGETHQSMEDGFLQIPEPYLAGLRAELGANLACIPAKGETDSWYSRLLGANGHAAGLHDEARFAIPGQNSDAMHSLERQLALALYTLRDAAGAAVVISDQDSGEIYYADAVTWVGKSTINPLAGRIDASIGFNWDGTDAEGVSLSGGTRARVAVYAWLDGSGDIQEEFERRVRLSEPESFRWMLDKKHDAWRTMEFPVVIDSAAPVIVSAEIDEGQQLTITLQDDQYLSYASVRDGAGLLRAEEAFFPERAGAECTLTMDLSSMSGLPDILYVTVEDYASNMAGYALDISGLADGEAPVFRRTVRQFLQDMNPDAWYWEAVDYAVSEGLMECDRQQNFRPNYNATRSDIVSALYRANGSPRSRLTPAGLPFIDLNTLTGGLDPLCWAYENGLVSGRSDGSFDGSAGVTRQELAVMLWRCAKLNGEAAYTGDLSAFSDAGSVSDWAREGVLWAVSHGLLQGNEGKLNPRSNVTRAETAQILQRFLEG